MPKTSLVGFAVACSLATAVAGQTYVDRTLGSGATSLWLSNVQYGSGLACADFDGDGDLDFVAAGDLGQSVSYFENLGNFQFLDRTLASGLSLHVGQFHGLTAADIDNDGDPDLYACRWFAAATLFINDGTGTFTEEAALRGVTHTSSDYCANFGDYDRDGWLDLYVGMRESQVGSAGVPNLLYRNLGNGQFQDVTQQAGVDDLGLTFATAFMDYNEDGWPDIIVVNDKGYAAPPNNLFRNNGDGTFTSVALQLGVDNGIDGMGVDYCDVYCDGGVDFFATDSGPYHLFNRWDDVQGVYVDVAISLGMFASSDGWACHWLDHDRDGWQDLYVVHETSADSLYLNPGQPPGVAAVWSDVAFSTGLALLHPHRCVAVGDFDDDGRLDFCRRNSQGPNAAGSGVTLLQGVGGSGNWIKFRTVGTVSNRDGIGARIDVHIGSHVQRQWVRSGTGYLSSSDLRLQFGAGAATTIDKVVVEWPSGQLQQLDDVAVNQIIDVVEPSMQLTAPAVVGGTTSLQMTVPTDASLEYAMVLAFSESPPSQIPDGRFLPLALDFLSSYTFVPGNTFLGSPLGVLDGQGRATTTLSIPNHPGYLGFTLYATGASFGPPGIPLVRTIFPKAVRVTIQ